MDAPLATAFEARGAGILECIVSLGAVGNTMTSVMSSMIVQPRIMLRMSSDGLLPESIGNLTSSGTPSTALIITIVVSSALALLIDFEALADIVSFGALISFLAVCLCTMLGRVVPPSSYRKPTVNQAAQTYGRPISPEESSTISRDQLRPHYPEKIIFMILLFEILTLAFGAFFLHDLVNIFLYVPLLVVCIIVGVATVRTIRVYMSDNDDASASNTFRVPGAPEVPLIGMFINTYMISGLPLAAVLRGLAVTAVAIIFYLSYSIRNSTLAVESIKNEKLTEPNGKYAKFEDEGGNNAI
ncbi:hypothetical protein FOL47_008585 [Perkinsus chesapeaki]|uniref:Cationic amino acid transporter C-terminal domain-containing protein n=1 Tax=Perkinsus chesapeaki TaxID=330153 RepID=A0A7J6LD45_PERCH|nr:hypothetical protein FOL47_008585 [Perkinsus chesapeaki]